MRSDDDMTARIRAILLQSWDPIGVADEPQAQDEYDAYVAGIARLVQAGASVEAVAAHLLALEREHMALPGRPDRAMAAARMLVALRS
jgi:hypothetical protein